MCRKKKKVRCLFCGAWIPRLKTCKETCRAHQCKPKQEAEQRSGLSLACFELFELCPTTPSAFAAGK